MKDKITAFILAGGKSQRMGTDKGLLPLAGKPFVSHICEAVKSIVGENIVIVSSNADYDFLGYKRIEDLVSDKGPVGGIYTALQYSRAKLNFILSVDAPLVSAELLLWILENKNDCYQHGSLIYLKGTRIIIFSDNSDNTLYKNKEDLKLKFLLRY